MGENRQGNFFGKNKDIERFIEVFRAMLPVVAFELCLALGFFLLSISLGDWRASALPIAILAMVSIYIDFLYMYCNWRNPMI